MRDVRPATARRARARGARSAPPSQRAPTISGSLSRQRRVSRPIEQADDEHRAVAGSRQQAGLGDRGAEAVAGRRRRLQELRQEREHRVHPEAEQQRDEVRRPDGGSRIIRMSISGSRARGSTTHPRRRAGRRRRRTGRATAAERPAPVRRPGSPPSSRATSQPDSSSAAPAVDPARACARATPAPEERAPHGRERRSSPAAARTASGSSGASTIGPASTRPTPAPTASSAEMRADRAGDLLARELVADDAERQREARRRRRPGSTRPTIMHADGGGQRGEQRARAASATSARTSIRSLPNMSPSRPTIGVNTDADSR